VAPIRIAIDALGGDLAPAAPVEGAVQALRAFDDVGIVLVGDPARIAAELDRVGATPAERARLEVKDAPYGVAGEADPVRAIRANEGVSARAAAEMLRRGEVDGVLNMGHTGAAVAAATLYCRRLEGVRRTGIAVPFPRPGGATILLDCGANPDAAPSELRQYAVMGTRYAQAALGVKEPRVGILSIGEEEKKGNRLVSETWAEFRARPVERFVGNVEPRQLFEDHADVVVCDGFAGNVVLKAAEGMAEFLARSLKDLGDPAARKALGSALARADYSEYGGAPLLGVDGAYVIGHGRSGPRAFVNGVRAVRAYVAGGVSAKITRDLVAERAAS
jgi:glycerol-3-phosphate acyltransferase PlsX